MASRTPRSFTLPTATTTTRTRGALSAGRAGHGQALGVEPEPFDVVETARLFLEHVHDHVTEIDEHPRRSGRAFHRERALFLALHARFFDGLCEGVDLPAGAAGHEHQKIGVVDLA